jgi:hypothetical protein
MADVVLGHRLPPDLVAYVLQWRDRLAAAEAVQSAWRGYRTRILIHRFAMLRYLAAFREWNPDLLSFLARARL